MRSAAAIANYMIARGIQEDRPLTHLKLQKLLYVAYGWYLARHGERLFAEPLQAWKYGPVVKSVYDALRSNGDEEIFDDVKIHDADGVQVPRLQLPEDGPVLRFLDDIWKAYSKYSAEQLTNYSHVPDSPWHRLTKDIGYIPPATDLSDQDIASYFNREHERLKGKFNPGVESIAH